ncbi:DUF3244 domain-containing protein [Larkinella terrae]|uniref:DUF3244 domain-containing protein n=1 Tax=Larkinella terrae TaxID=2025311 RepID=A0A7K0EJJ7_9BACT|nr:DUF3244 domain-containing protein [Larkinella terrae]MRS62019.1 DUF3244 domain-containing protein [Larkinella terrae]
MKTVHQIADHSLRALLVIVLLFTTLVATAQPDFRSGNDQGKGYWKIQTDYATRNTVIRFFNARSEPIYQETIRGKYVKLTKRNMRLFDEMLNRMVNSELLASQVKSYDLLATNDFRYSSVSSSNRFVPSEKPAEEFVPIENRLFMANPFISESAKLRVSFANPEQKKVQIELTDDESTTVYYNESSYLAGYNRYFDIRHLSSGKYHLKLKSPDQTLNYLMTINKPYQEYSLKAIK